MFCVGLYFIALFVFSCKTNACEGKDGQSEEDRKGEIQAGLHLLSSCGARGITVSI